MNIPENITKEVLEKLYVDENLTLSQIGEKLNVSAYFVKKYLIYYDIPIMSSADKLRGKKQPDSVIQKRVESMHNRTAEQKAKSKKKYQNTRYTNFEEKEKIRKAKRDITIKNNGTDIGKAVSEGWKNRSEEDKEKYSKESSMRRKQEWNSLSDEQRQLRGKAISDGWKSLSQEKINNIVQNRLNTFRENESNHKNKTNPIEYSNRIKASWAKKSKEELAEILHKQHETKLKNGTLLIGNGSNSKPNKKFAQLLDDNNINYTREFVLENFKYDFKINNILVEINPSVTHNSIWSPFGNHEGLDKNYHLNKTLCANKFGYRCIHVFDWDDFNKIINLLKSRETLYARKCYIKETNTSDTKNYLNKYHLQNYAKSTINLGLYYNDELVSLMTFGKPRYNKKFDYELIRYCSTYNVIGGAEKLFKYFIKTYNPNSIVSYCDKSKFEGKIYDKLGFTLCNVSSPSCHWYNLKTKQHITDNLLRQRGFDQLFNTNYGKGTSNEQLMLEHNFVKVYDCGQCRYEFYTL